MTMPDYAHRNNFVTASLEHQLIISTSALWSHTAVYTSMHVKSFKSQKLLTFPSFTLFQAKYL